MEEMTRRELAFCYIYSQEIQKQNSKAHSKKNEKKVFLYLERQLLHTLLYDSYKLLYVNISFKLKFFLFIHFSFKRGTTKK